jgi:competence ComEA-like helix-hairpin-helix protein
MKIRTIIFDYFSFNRAEQRGIAVLLSILVALLALNRFWPSQPLFPQENEASFARDVLAFTEQLKKSDENARFSRKPGKKVYSYFPAARRDTAFRQEKSRQPSFTVEINAADTMELQRLRGIGPGYARRIVSYRNKLGGFCAKLQLLEVYGMDRDRYGMICDHITVEPDSVKKIDINNVTFKALISHPYFPYELTREIILFRKKAKRFNTAEELKNVKGMNDSVFLKISPYILVR